MARESRNDKREYLGQYRIAEQRLLELNEELERVRAVAEKVTPNLDGMPHGGSGGDRVANGATALVELQRKLEERTAEYLETQRNVCKVVNLSDFQYRPFLEMRYLACMTYEQIRERIPKSGKQGKYYEDVRSIHENIAKGLDSIPDNFRDFL